MRRFEANVFPHIGRRPVSEVQAPELVAMLKAIEEPGVKVFISALAPATGRARLIFKSIPADANEPELIS